MLYAHKAGFLRDCQGRSFQANTLDISTVVYFLLGDGGNDVSMIQAANVGVGIEGKV